MRKATISRKTTETEVKVSVNLDGTEDGRISVIDLDARRRDGTLCPIQAHFSRMVYGERDCIICVFNDNSERKELEREVLQVATRIQQRIGGDLHDEVGDRKSTRLNSSHT